MLTRFSDFTSFATLRDSLSEAISDDLNPLLSSIHAKRVALRGLSVSDTLDTLEDSQPFDEVLKSRKLRRGRQVATEDFEVFSRFKLKMMPIYNENELDIADPVYLLLQEETDAGWSGVQAYAVHGDIVKLYDALSARTIELKKEGASYIYETSNSGKNWLLKNTQATSQFESSLSTHDIKKLLKDESVSLTVVD